jgi:outer membrane lipoprotein-sorting protein
MAVTLLTLACSLAGMAAAWGDEFRPDLPGLSPQQKIDLIMAQMAKVQKDAHTITAQFSMEKKMTLLAAPVRADGIMYVTKPDKIYWEVKAPIANTLIVNGETLWIYYPALRQVDKVDISGKQKKVMQYLEMSEEGSVIKENYRIRLIENSNEKGVFVLELLPRTSRIGKRIAKIRVWVDSQTWFLTRMDIWEPNGDYSIIKLKDAKLNVPIQDSVYDFRPPPGTAINEPLKTSPSRSER